MKLPFGFSVGRILVSRDICWFGQTVFFDINEKSLYLGVMFGHKEYFLTNSQDEIGQIESDNHVY